MNDDNDSGVASAPNKPPDIFSEEGIENTMFYKDGKIIKTSDFNLNLKDVIKIQIKDKSKLSIEFNNYFVTNRFVENNQLNQKGCIAYILCNQETYEGLIDEFI